eukprot:CAMPEP_0113689698 /NCGR_PEP_ID=MMETSP0038_2-20120614/17334_1 /TAXON_ID=2898 /ORGANISM="Cryptomonas paramecium" /LENGTH=201 /DNA_ID=CAMNT_0000610849 /DNA_START=24 /DNA_END=626 /DNA_ORIENTATION=+ /assembly_acc=CAM_ASM_000170
MKREGERSVSCPPYIVSEDSVPIFGKKGESTPFLFTEDAKKAFAELHKLDSDGARPDQTKHSLKLSRRHGAHSQNSDQSGSKLPKDHQQTAFPPITMLLKPKDQSKVKLSMRPRQNNQVDPAKVTDLSVSEQSLKNALSKLRESSSTSGFSLNTKTLWRQSSFLPPSSEKKSTLVQQRSREFDEWREDAWQTFHRANRTAP